MPPAWASWACAAGGLAHPLACTARQFPSACRVADGQLHLGEVVMLT
jgi:hypothetical protein